MAAYTEEKKEQLFQLALIRIQEGESLRAILRNDPEMPTRVTFYAWMREKDERINLYARATEIRADNIFEEIFDIADDGQNDYSLQESKTGEVSPVFDSEHVQRSRLRIDSRKWALSKMNPKKYGDKIGMEHSGSVDSKISLNVNFKNFGNDES